ncbi:UNVERIFIED_CONTAM: hypothetical protein K2H54_077423, partial [Gekko kuhli]
LYWDFQLLDSDHDGYLSVRDAELLLGEVPHAAARGEAWQEFLRSRGPGVAWRDIEDWLFRATQLPVDESRVGRRRALHRERGTSARSSTSLYQWGVRSRTEQPLERWDSGGLSTLLGEEPSGVLAALERKYRVLQRKLCAEMLQAHYGQSVWASLPQNMKEDKLSELELLVDCGLRKGSILSLACLPGARLSIRPGMQVHDEGEGSVQCVSPSATEGIAAQALEELRRRKQAETAALLAQQHLLVGSNPEASRRLLHLHAQTALVQQEASFQAALFITELFQGERFWDSQPVVPEACHQELAQLRLAVGHGSEPAWREAKTVPGRSMAQVLLDRLLLQHERDRASLVQILQILTGTGTACENPHDGKQLILPGAGRREDPSPALQEAIGQMLSLAQKRLEVAGRAEVPWWDCAVAVLVDLQLAQEEELRQTIEDLVGIVSGREGESCPALYENLLARLQEPLLMSLTQRLQAVPPQEKNTRESLKMGPGPSTQELSPGEREAQKMLQRGDSPDGPQKQMESQGPLLKKLKTCEHQDGEKDSEDHQNSVAPQTDQNRTEDQQRSLDAFLLQTKSKSWGPPEMVKPQVLMPKGLRNRAVVPQIPQTPHNLGDQCKQEGPDCQAQNNPKCLAQGDVREATDHESQISPERKEVPLQGTELSACRVSHYQKEKDPEFSNLQEALLEKSKSLDPQELSRPWCNDEHCRSPQREEEISGPQDCRFPKDCQPERCQETKAPETLQHHQCPGSEEKAVQVPQKEPEAEKRRGRQKLDALQQKSDLSCPQELRNTKACQTEPFCAQEKLQRNLSRPQATKPCKKAKKEPEAQTALSKKTKSLKSKETSWSQGPIPQENIHTQERPEGRPQDFPQREAGPLQASTQGRRTPEKKGLGTIQEQKEPQNHYEMLPRKSKSLEPRRPPPFPSQEPKAPCQQGCTQMGPGALEPKKRRQAEDFQSQKQRQKPQSGQPGELLQKQGAAQEGEEITGPQATKTKEDFLPEEKTRSELSRSQESEAKKSKPLDSRESHKKKDLEPIQDQGTAQQRQKGMLQIQEYGRPESPPLLWSVLWQKAKSFDVGKPYIFPILKLRKLEEALSHGIPQKMKGSSMTQLQIHKLQEDKRPESPPLLWRILWQKSKSFEVRKSCALEAEELRRSLIVQLQQGGPQIEKEAQKLQEPKILREESHLTQGTRKVEMPQAQGTPQRKTRDLEEMPWPKDSVGDAQQRQDPQALQSKTQRMSERDLHPQNSRDSETPPLLWRVLGMKAKSFELRRPGPRAFRTQQARKLEPSFLASREMKRLETTQRQGGPQVKPESQKLRDLGPQRLQTISQSGKIFPQETQMETQPERRSPETPPLMWWVLETGRQGMPHGKLKEEEMVPLQKSVQGQSDPQDTSSGRSNTSGPKERKDLETSMTQEKATEGCNPDNASHCHVPASRELGGPGNPHTMKAQGMLGCSPEGFGCSEPSGEEKIKSNNCLPHETPGHNKTDSLLPPEKLPGKSKSLDVRELRPPKPPELRELESPEAQGRPKAFQIQEDHQMKSKKVQPTKDPQAHEALERRDLEGSQAHGTQSLLQPQGQGGEVLLSVRSSSQLKPVELMEPHVLPPQELVVLHVQGMLQVDPKALKFQRHIDPKALSLPGLQEAGSSGCEFHVEEKPTEVQGDPRKNPQNCPVQEATQLQADPLGNSASFGVQELSKPCFFQSQETQNQAPRCPQVPEDQALKELETLAPQVTTQMVAEPSQDAMLLEAEHESPVQKNMSNPEVSQPQEEIEEKEPGAPDYTDVEVLQKETEDLQLSEAPQMEHTGLSFGATDLGHTQELQVEETPPKKPESSGTVDHEKPSTWLSPGYSELWEFWRTLGKSKSLDLRELRALQLESLGELGFSRLQDKSRTKIWQPQRKPQDDPMEVHSKFLPIHELILKDQAARQPEEGGGCEVRRPQLTGLEPLRTKAEVLSPQQLEDAQVFCPKRCEAIEAGEEPLQVPGSAEGQPEATEPQELTEPKPIPPEENRDVESPPLLKGLLRKSKTLGPETWTRRDVSQVHEVRKIESRSGQGTPKTQLQEEGSHNIWGPSKEPQEMLNDVEGNLEPPRPEKAKFQREARTTETGTTEAEEPLPVDCDLRPEEGDAPFTSPERSQVLPPHQAPQFGIERLQELGRLHKELEMHGPQEWKDQEAVQHQEAQEVFEPEGQVAVEPQGVLCPRTHPGWQSTESHQLEQKIPEAPGTLQEIEEDQGLCQSPGILNKELGSRHSPNLEIPQTPQWQECLPETSPVVPVVSVSHPVHSQEFRVPAIFCPQESPEIGWEFHEDEGKEVQTDLGPSELQEHYTLAPQGSLQWKSKSLDPQDLPGRWDFQGQRGDGDLRAQRGEVRQPEEEAAETRKAPAVTAFSPPSPGRHEAEELTWEPAALSVGLSRESSSGEARPGRASRLSWRPPEEEGVPAEGEGATEPPLPESQQARPWKVPSPRPPRREKAFIWLSRQEQEEALQQLAELRAEGELRHRRDKERQILRFQERLSIAKHRKSEDDLLGSSPAERWTPPAEHHGQDQGGQKTAVKRHLEKVKRERTYVMQSKRERNMLRFKELLDPLVAPGEENPEPGQPRDE